MRNSRKGSKLERPVLGEGERDRGVDSPPMHAPIHEHPRPRTMDREWGNLIGLNGYECYMFRSGVQ